MGKFVFTYVALLAIYIAYVYCNHDEQTLNAILRNQVEGYNSASDDESDVQNLSCDCDYRNRSIWRKGGCRIVHPAPPGLACYCKYKGGWTCGGTIVHCHNKGSHFCKHPDRSIGSCKQGGGDCGGYW